MSNYVKKLNLKSFIQNHMLLNHQVVLDQTKSIEKAYLILSAKLIILSICVGNNANPTLASPELTFFSMPSKP